LHPDRKTEPLIDTAVAEQAGTAAVAEEEAETQEVRWGEVTVEKTAEVGTTVEVSRKATLEATAEAGTTAVVGTAAEEAGVQEVCRRRTEEVIRKAQQELPQERTH
jgi:hypothetical protein